MQYGELLDLIEVRARNLGIEPDAGAFLLYLFGSLMDLVETYDFEEYVALSEPGQPWFTTISGVEVYSLPSNFGRLIHPRDEGKYGVKLNDGSSKADLVYKTPLEFDLLDRTQTGRPSQFTILQQQMHLYLRPDSNNTLNYDIEGPYILAVERPNLDETVLLREPKVLVSETLMRIASDRGLPQTAALLAEANWDKRVLVTNEHKRRQRLFDSDRRHQRRWN